MIENNNVVAYAIVNIKGTECIMYSNNRPAIYNNISRAKAMRTRLKKENYQHIRIIKLSGKIYGDEIDD